jgi:hypothetical protein
LLTLGFLVIVWVGGIGFGVKQVWTYSTTPGPSNPHPARWPADSRIVRPRDRMTLVMFMHPFCSCSVASLAELSGVVQSHGSALRTYVVFLRPGDADSSWLQTGTLESARRMPGVQVLADLDGKEAERFGAVTSGQVVLYDAAGALRFAGGLTGSRGHAGDSPGRQRLLSVLRGQEPDRTSSSVYGCPIAAPEPNL